MNFNRMEPEDAAKALKGLISLGLTPKDAVEFLMVTDAPEPQTNIIQAVLHLQDEEDEAEVDEVDDSELEAIASGELDLTGSSVKRLASILFECGCELTSSLDLLVNCTHAEAVDYVKTTVEVELKDREIKEVSQSQAFDLSAALKKSGASAQELAANIKAMQVQLARVLPSIKDIKPLPGISIGRKGKVTEEGRLVIDDVTPPTIEMVGPGFCGTLVVRDNPVNSMELEFLINGEAVGSIFKHELSGWMPERSFDFGPEAMFPLMEVQTPASDPFNSLAQEQARAVSRAKELSCDDHISERMDRISQALAIPGPVIKGPTAPSVTLETQEQVSDLMGPTAPPEPRSKWDMPEPELDHDVEEPGVELLLIDHVARLAMFYFEAKATAQMTSHLRGHMKFVGMLDEASFQTDFWSIRGHVFERFVEVSKDVAEKMLDGYPTWPVETPELARAILMLIERRASQVKLSSLAESVKQIEIFLMDVVFSLCNIHLSDTESDYQEDWSYCLGPVAPGDAALMMHNALEDQIQGRIWQGKDSD